MSLFDRGYMRNPYAGAERRDDSGRSMLFTLILINLGVFLSTLFTPESLLDTLMLSSGGIRQFKIFQLVTAGFLHVDFWHFFFNMWGLYIFGGLVAPNLGGKRFLWLYLAGAVAGNLLFLILNWYSPVRLLGASGAVFAVMVGAAMFEPNRQFIVFPAPFPVRTRTLVVCYTVLEILLMVSGTQDGIAHLAHLGGVLGVLGVLLAALGQAADHRGQRGADGAVERGAGATARRGSIGGNGIGKAGNGHIS